MEYCGVESVKEQVNILEESLLCVWCFVMQECGAFMQYWEHWHSVCRRVWMYSHCNYRMHVGTRSKQTMYLEHKYLWCKQSETRYGKIWSVCQCGLSHDSLISSFFRYVIPGAVLFTLVAQSNQDFVMSGGTSPGLKLLQRSQNQLKLSINLAPLTRHDSVIFINLNQDSR